MKKLLSLLLAALLVSMCIVSVSAADESKGLAKSAQGTPVIDGEIDAVWANAEVYPLNGVYLDKSPDPSIPLNGTKAQFRTLWDKNRLYVLVEVTDSTVGDEAWELTTVGAAQLYKRNSVMFMLSPDVSFAEKPPVKLILSSRAIGGGEYVLNDGTANFNNVVRDTFKEFRTKVTDTGWLIEIAFDLTHVDPGFTLTAGTKLGFDCYVNDNIPMLYDDRTALITWADEAGSSWNNAATLGVIELVGAAETTTADPVTTAAPETTAAPATTAAPVTTAAPTTTAPAQTPATADSTAILVATVMLTAVALTLVSRRRCR